MNLEDETGLVNVICGAGFWVRHRRVARDEPAVFVRGILEGSPEGVVNVLADAIEPLRAGVAPRSRDFR
jgi:error-prone DNA polymerase